MQFTKEQLIEHIGKRMDDRRGLLNKATLAPGFREYLEKEVATDEIALASLTAPDDIPPHVLDAMSDMCDGGFDAQGIWDLCREAIMPPTSCPRCGTVSDRPDGVHYCHVGANGV